MNNLPKISIIIVNFNGHTFLSECLKSIKLSDYKNYEVIVIDNASTDDSIKLAQKINAPNTKYQILNTNLGFSEANNQASKISSGKLLFFLNNDTKLNKNTLTNLVKVFNNNQKIGIVTCRIVSYDGKNTFHSGIGIDILGFPVNLGKTFYAEGSALLICKYLFIKLQGFDSSYFMFHEDIDLCWRTWLLGYEVKTTPNAIVYHYAGGSAGGTYPGKNKYQSTLLRRYYSERNNIKTLLKNYSFITLLIIIPLYLFINIIEFLLFLLTFQPKIIYLYIKSYIWNIINFKSTLKQRSIIQKQRKINDIEIIKKMYLGIGKFYIFKQTGIPKFK